MSWPLILITEAFGAEHFPLVWLCGPNCLSNEEAFCRLFPSFYYDKFCFRIFTVLFPMISPVAGFAPSPKLVLLYLFTLILL